MPDTFDPYTTDNIVADMIENNTNNVSLIPFTKHKYKLKISEQQLWL